VGLFAEAIDMLAQPRSLIKSRLQEIRTPQRPTKLLDQVRDAIRLKHCAYSTEKTHVYWSKRFVLCHDKRHPQEMGEKEIKESLTYLASLSMNCRWCPIRGGHYKHIPAPSLPI